MNNLQKISELLALEGRTIIYGKPTSAAEGNVIALSIGDGDNAVRTLGDGYAAMYTTVNIDVYCSDYSAGYDLLLAVRGEIQSALKSTVGIVFLRFLASEYDEQLERHVLKSQYRITE